MSRVPLGVSSLFACLFAFQFTGHDGGRVQTAPVVPPKPAKLEVVVSRADWESKEELAVTVLLRNAGDGELKIDPMMLQARWELITLFLTDEAGKRVRFVGDDIAAAVPLSPERCLPLWPHTFYGIDVTLRVPHPGRQTFVRAVVGYPDLKPNVPVWTGAARSTKTQAKPFVPEKVAIRRRLR